MALTQISTAGVKDDLVTAAKIADDAVTEALVADESVDEARLKISNAGSNGQFLSKQSGNTGGLTWATPAGGAGGATGLDVNDDVKIRLGTGNDLEIYHDGSHSYIKDEGTGKLRILGNEILIGNAADSENIAKFIENGAVELYHDNSKKLETTSGGITVTGGVTTTTASTFVGDVTFDNGTNAGRDVIWDESLDVLKFKDNTNLGLGDDSDLLLYHNGHSYVSNRSGDLYIVQSVDQGNGIFLEPKPSEAGVKIFRNGAVALYNDNSKKFETHSGGVSVHGHCSLTGADSYELRLGAGSDLKIFHDGSNSHIHDNGTGALKIRTNELQLLNAAGDEYFLSGVENGAVGLYHDNTLSFSTTAAGLAFNDSTNSQEIWFSDSNDADAGKIVYDHTHDSMEFFAWGSERLSIISNSKVQTNLDFKPGSDDSLDIGASGARFDDVYATNGSIQTSDRNEKESITATDLGLEFINKLTPVSFKRKGKTRTHYGLIAQDVETVITDLGKNTTQFAPIIKEDISEKQDGSNIRYGLRYDELISPLVKAVQEQQAEIETLKTKVAALEAA